MSMKSKQGLNPENIPPTEDSETQHAYRVYLQVNQWKTLSNSDMYAENWGIA